MATTHDNRHDDESILENDLIDADDGAPLLSTSISQLLTRVPQLPLKPMTRYTPRPTRLLSEATSNQIRRLRREVDSRLII